MRALFLGFLAAAVIGYFEIKENVYSSKKKKKETNFELKKTQVDLAKSDQEWKESNYRFVLWICLIIILLGVISLIVSKL